jgi:hypothetical protein
MSQEKIFVGSVLSEPSSVVVQRHDLFSWYHSTLIHARYTDLSLVDVISKVNEVVDAIFTCSITVCVKVAPGELGA